MGTNRRQFLCQSSLLALVPFLLSSEHVQARVGIVPISEPDVNAGGKAMIQAVFFDVGNTLASRKKDGSLDVLPGTTNLLDVMRNVLNLRLGVISNVPDDMTTEALKRLLSDAKLLAYFDPNIIVTSKDAGADKPGPRIYAYAAERANLSPASCAYVGENAKEVDGAQAAGMSGILKPFPPPSEK